MITDVFRVCYKLWRAVIGQTWIIGSFNAKITLKITNAISVDKK